MNISYFNIALDIKETQSQVSIPMKRGCTNYGVRITLVDGNKPYNITKECIALFSATKPDGAIIENNCTINKNKINYKVTDQTVAASGVLDCAIMLYGADEELLASAHFTIVVDERAVGDVPVSEDEKNFFDSMVTSEIARRESEEERIKAEEERNTAEAQRVEAENGRIEAEEERNTAEAQRVEAENGRIEAEALRDADELSRNTAEEGRVTAEAQRVEAENGRVSAEKSRVNRFAKMESDMEEHLEDLDSRYRLGTQEMVNKWLNEHPEATTTVQDHSLFLDAFVFGELGYVTPQMFKGKYDEDDTFSIQYALDFAHDNNIGVVYIPAGTYRVNGIESTNNRGDVFACGLVIHSNTKLIMDKNAILRLETNGHCKSCVLRCDYLAENIEITGGQIYGDRMNHYGAIWVEYKDATGETQYKLVKKHNNIVPTVDGKFLTGEHGVGIYVGGNKNVKISNCIIRDTVGDGILVFAGGEIKQGKFSFDTPAKNILVDNVVIETARRNGISLVGVSGCTISNSTIRETGNLNCPICGSDTEIKEVIREDETVDYVPYCAKCECEMEELKDAIYGVEGNNPKFGIDIEASPYDINSNENILITNCNFESSTGAGIGCVGTADINANNIKITDCNFKDNKEGIMFGSITKVTIANSSFDANIANGISLSSIDDFTVSDCIICNSIATSFNPVNGVALNGSGLYLYGNCSGVVERCILDDNDGDGIQCNGCQESGLIIRSCLSKNNDVCGINIRADMSSLTTTVYNNSIPILVDGCECRDNDALGISVFAHPKVKVNNCILLYNKSFGVGLCNRCDYGEVANCHFEGNCLPSGYDLGCYGNKNAKIVNNSFRMGKVAHSHPAMTIGYYNATTENIFVAENDCRGMVDDIKEMTSGVGVVTTGTIFGKNIKNDGTYA